MTKKVRLYISIGVFCVLFACAASFIVQSDPIDDAATNSDNGDVACVVNDEAGQYTVLAYDHEGTLLFQKVLSFPSGGSAYVFYDGEMLCVHAMRDGYTYVYDRSGNRLEKQEADREDIPKQSQWEGWDRSWSVYEITEGKNRYVYDTANVFEMIFGKRSTLFMENEQGERTVLWEKN